MKYREKRVVDAFITCVHSGEYTLDYAIILIEDQQKYGWISPDGKARFYAAFAEPEAPGGEDILGNQM